MSEKEAPRITCLEISEEPPYNMVLEFNESFREFFEATVGPLNEDTLRQFVEDALEEFLDQNEED